MQLPRVVQSQYGHADLSSVGELTWTCTHEIADLYHKADHTRAIVVCMSLFS